MKKYFLYFLFLAAPLISIVSCHKDDTSDSLSPDQDQANTIEATIAGIVIDESNNPLSGVSVSSNLFFTTTDQNGIFTLKNARVDKDRCVIEFSKGGYFHCSRAIVASGNTVNYVRMVMVSNAATHYLSSAGGTVTLADGSSILFPSNAFVTQSGISYSGTVNICMKHLSPDAPGFGFMIPGGDLLGKNISGSTVTLTTYGMLGVEISGAGGEPLQLAPGSSATLTMPIASSQLASAPASIPLWYFDESTSLWKEEGSASRSGSVYSGSVSHFTWWNCDHPAEIARVMGRVVDCEGTPMPNIVVTLNGWATLLTDQFGRYDSWVPSGTPFTVQVLASNNNSIVLDSQLENVPALSPNTIYVVPDLAVDCPSAIAGRLRNCAGEFIEGLVHVSWNSEGVFQYVNSQDSGLFFLPCPPNAQVDLLAYTNVNGDILSYSNQYQTLAVDQTLEIGDLSLCDSLAEVHLNNVTINGGQFLNYEMSLISINLSTVSVDSTSGHLEIFCYGYTGEYQLTYDVKFSDTIPGSYPFTAAMGNNFPYMYFQNGVDTFNVSTFGMYCGPGTLNLLHFGAAGERVTGNFSGIATLDRPLPFGQTPVTISGNFDVLRDH